MKKSMKRTLALLLTLCMVIPMCLVSLVSAESSPIVKEYSFVDTSFMSEGDALDIYSANATTGSLPLWKEMYASYKSNDEVTSIAIALGNYNASGRVKAYYNGAPHSSRATGFTGLATTSSKAVAEGTDDWIAVMVKNPGKTGNYELNLSYRGYYNSSRLMNVYLIPASKIVAADVSIDNFDFSDAAASDFQGYYQGAYAEAITSLINDAEGKYLIGSVNTRKSDQSNYPNDNVTFDVNIEETGEYVIVFEAEEGYNAVATTGALLVSGMTLTEIITEYDITVDANITGGTVSVSPESAAAGTTVTITATPDDGMELDALTVTDASGNSVTVTDNAFTMPASNVTVSATFAEEATVPTDAYVYEFEDSSVTYDSAYAYLGTQGNDAIMGQNYGTNKWMPYADSLPRTDGYYSAFLRNDIATTVEGGDPVLGLRGGTNGGQVVSGEWMAIRIKNPGTGTLTPVLGFYRQSNMKCTVNVYIIPGDTEIGDIEGAMTSANQYGAALNLYAVSDLGTQANGAYYQREMTSFESNADDGDYIVVFEIDSLVNDATSTHLYIDDITFLGNIEEGTGPNTNAATSEVYFTQDGVEKSFYTLDAAVNYIATLNTNDLAENVEIKLVKDMIHPLAYMYSYAKTIVDLNGHTLSLDSANIRACLMDSSENTAGSLIIAATDGLALNGNNDNWLPLKRADGSYGMYQASAVALGIREGSDSCAFWFRLRFYNDAAYSLLNTTEGDTNCLTISGDLSVGGVSQATWIMTANTVGSYIDMAISTQEGGANEGKTAAVYVNVLNISAAGEETVTVTPSFTVGDITITADALSYPEVVEEA